MCVKKAEADRGRRWLRPLFCSAVGVLYVICLVSQYVKVLLRGIAVQRYGGFSWLPDDCGVLVPIMDDFGV